MIRKLCILAFLFLPLAAFAQGKTYYYVATAYNSSGLESATSNEASKTVSPSDKTAVLTWTLPTMNTDGSALTDLAGIRVYRSATMGGCANAVAIAIPNGCTEVTDTKSATLVTYTDSPPLPTVPAAPTNLAVQATNQTAYTLQLAEGKMALVPVGTLNVGEMCDGAQVLTDGNGITAHPVVNPVVNWSGTAQPHTVFAVCGS